MAIQFEIVLWESHPKWVVDCGQHMEVKCSLPERQNPADLQGTGKKMKWGRSK